MPPTLALILTLGFMGFLYRRDFRERPNITSALWLPFLWLFIIASKTPSQWLHILGVPGFGATAVEEGSSLDPFVFAALIAWGFYVLSKRGVNLSEILRDNAWLTLFVLYCFLAVFWSDFPLTSFKRWIKVLGHPVMVLIIFTEPDPQEALVRVMKRCAYVVLPVSILWMKYFPSLGRHASEWGSMGNCGIAGSKNELGALSFMMALFFLWYFLQVWKREKGRDRRDELLLVCGLLFLSGYCLRKSHSATSVLSLVLGALIMLGLGLRFVDKRLIGVYVVTGLLVVLFAQLTFDVYGSVIELTGHGNTIEGRGRLWQYLWETDDSPLLGTGFESYWLGDRLRRIWSMPEFQWRPTQAHNGYLEAYLNLGAVGVVVLMGLIIATFRKCTQDLLWNFEWGRLTMSYLFAIVAHNWTEAGFKGLSMMLLVFFIIAIHYPRLRTAAVIPSSETSDREQELEPIYSYDKS